MYLIYIKWDIWNVNKFLYPSLFNKRWALLTLYTTDIWISSISRWASAYRSTPLITTLCSFSTWVVYWARIGKTARSVVKIRRQTMLWKRVYHINKVAWSSLFTKNILHLPAVWVSSESSEATAKRSLSTRCAISVGSACIVSARIKPLSKIYVS